MSATKKARPIAARTEIVVPIHLSAETRDDGALRLSGLAAVYSSASEDIGFREVLEPGAFRDALAASDSDPTLLWQHRSDQPLARVSAGNLELRDTTRGLEFTATLPKTTLARDAVELVRAGVVKAMSFAFTMSGGKDRWENRDGEDWRYISKVGKLLEISLVTSPAYAATSVAARSRGGVDPDVLAARVKATLTRLHYAERSSYGPGAEHSYFRDLATVKTAEQRQWQQQMAGHRHAALSMGDSIPGPGVDRNPENAQRRLRVAAEQRDLTTTAGAGGGFIPTGVPAFVGDMFAASARAAAAMTSVLPVEQLPASGMTLVVPRIASGAAAAIQASQNSTVTELDLIEGLGSNPIGTIVGQQDVSQQLFDRSDPGIDEVLSVELGRALGTALDQQILGGTGTNGQLLGLTSVAGIGSTAYTDATPTQAEGFPKVLQSYADQAAALGEPGTVIVMSPRRYAWFANWRDANGLPAVIPWPARVIQAPALPVNGGAGTNEDYVLVLRADELPVYLEDPRLEVFPSIGSGTLTVRIRVRQYAASLFTRRPEAIQKVAGTGFVPPVFS